jgi:hypothetical protein
MHVKMYKVRSVALANGKKTLVDLHLEFEGKRAFVIWDTVPIGEFQFTARLEIDPDLLRKSRGRGCDFFYCGDLVLPCPRNN